MYERMEAGSACCSSCTRRCQGFLTDREQRRVGGVGILYLLGFPILCCMILVGALKVNTDNCMMCDDILQLLWLSWFNFKIHKIRVQYLTLKCQYFELIERVKVQIINTIGH